MWTLLSRDAHPRVANIRVITPSAELAELAELDRRGNGHG
jgi:hypothetical protein